MSLTYEQRHAVVVTALTDLGAQPGPHTDLKTLATSILRALDGVKETVR